MSNENSIQYQEEDDPNFQNLNDFQEEKEEECKLNKFRVGLKKKIK